MGRPHVECVDARDVPQEPVDDGVLAGAQQRVLSRDEEDGAYTALVTLPSGWSADLSGTDRAIELYCIRGDLTVAGKASGGGCYAYLPGGADRALATTDGALAMVFVRAEENEGGDVTIVDSGPMDWTMPERLAEDGGDGMGILVKPLHHHEATGDSTWLAGIAPGWFLARAERHPVDQEVFMLAGDVLLPGHGPMTNGLYFWRPAYGMHGPLVSRYGALILMRSFTSDFTTEWFDAPGFQELHAEYLAERPLFVGEL